MKPEPKFFHETPTTAAPTPTTPAVAPTPIETRPVAVPCLAVAATAKKEFDARVAAEQKILDDQLAAARAVQSELEDMRAAIVGIDALLSQAQAELQSHTDRQKVLLPEAREVWVRSRRLSDHAADFFLRKFAAEALTGWIQEWTDEKSVLEAKLAAFETLHGVK